MLLYFFSRSLEPIIARDVRPWLKDTNCDLPFVSALLNNKGKLLTLVKLMKGHNDNNLCTIDSLLTSNERLLRYLRNTLAYSPGNNVINLIDESELLNDHHDSLKKNQLHDYGSLFQLLQANYSETNENELLTLQNDMKLDLNKVCTVIESLKHVENLRRLKKDSNQNIKNNIIVKSASQPHFSIGYIDLLGLIDTDRRRCFIGQESVAHHCKSTTLPNELVMRGRRGIIVDENKLKNVINEQMRFEFLDNKKILLATTAKTKIWNEEMLLMTH